MKGSLLYLFLIIISSLSVVDSQRWGGGIQSERGFHNTYGNSAVYPQPTATSKLTQSSRGIGAWGYVGIILTVILTGMAAYYFVIFYPIVCKKERKYDVMEMTAV